MNNDVENPIETNTNPEAVKESLSPRDLEAHAERAHSEAMHSALDVKTKGKNVEKKLMNHSPSHHGLISQKQLDESYARTLKQVQDELSASDRLFSKITHNKVIDKTSDALGSTIFRPNAMLSGAISAFILTLLVYLTAKTMGYVLSGFETIAAFAIGWLIGIVFDYLRILFVGKRP